MNHVLLGDCLSVLAGLPERSVHCCVSSPPYWGLRNYGIPDRTWSDGSICSHGLEPTLDLYVQHEVEVLRAIRRVLRDDGVVWWNIGDSYATNSPGTGNMEPVTWNEEGKKKKAGMTRVGRVAGLKPLDLCGVPWRVALAAQADGWWLRSAICWAKGESFNPERSGSVMPESVNGVRWERCRVKMGKGGRSNSQGQCAGLVDWNNGSTGRNPDSSRHPELNAKYQDCLGCAKCLPNNGFVLKYGSGRPTSAYEMLYLFTKSPNYYYDSEAIREYPNMPTVRNRKADSRVQSGVSQSNGIQPSMSLLCESETQAAGLRLEIRQDGILQKDATDIFKVGLGAEDEATRGATEITKSRLQGTAKTLCTEIQQDREGESPPKKILVNTQREATQEREREEIQGKSIGSGVCKTQQYEEASDIEGDGMQSNPSRMGSDKGETEPSVHLLQAGDGTVDTGSRDAIEQGRSAHRQQHSGSLPELQREKGSEDNKSGVAGRNLRNVWRIPLATDVLAVNTRGYKEAHFATFCEELVVPCIKISTSERGVCPTCGCQWARVVDNKQIPRNELNPDDPRYRPNRYKDNKYSRELRDDFESGMYSESQTLGWLPTCECYPKQATLADYDRLETAPAVVLDPFGGSLTVAVVAKKLGRDSISIEIKPEYVEMGKKRLAELGELL